jgi:hypothetical protein
LCLCPFDVLLFLFFVRLMIDYLSSSVCLLHCYQYFLCLFSTFLKCCLAKKVKKIINAIGSHQGKTKESLI